MAVLDEGLGFGVGRADLAADEHLPAGDAASACPSDNSLAPWL